MINRMQLIVDGMREKLQDNYPSVVDEIKNCMDRLKISDADINGCMHFLLKTACKFNLLKETHDLLELNLFKDVDQPLQLEKEDTDKSYNNSNDKTLLGLAAFHGHIELVSYLVEVRQANVNAKDVHGDTPLHQVVYGDSHPFNHDSCGISHDKVAKYLIRHGGDLSIKNNEQKTPYDNTKWCAPLKIEDMIGRRFITNTGYAAYYADKVRPVFEKELSLQSQNQDIPRIKINDKKDFDKFCLEHAIEVYVKNKEAAFGYSSIEELYQALDTLPEKEWEYIKRVISSQRPAPYSFKFGLISNQLSALGRQSALIGLGVMLVVYYETQSILLSVATGSLSATLAWNYLTEAAYKQKTSKISIKEQRINELQQHCCFFKAPSIPHIQRLDDIQYKGDGSMKLRGLS